MVYWSLCLTIFRNLKGHSQLWDRAGLDTSFLTLKSSPQPEIKEHLEFRFNLRKVLLDSQSFTEKPEVFLVCFCSSYNVVFIIFGENSMDRVSAICKLTVKCYLMRMCTS